MESRLRDASRGVCRCDHHAPPLRIIRSVGFNRELALKVRALGLSGAGTVNQVETELLDHHVSRLFGPDGNPVVLDTDDPVEVARWDGLFSEDGRRSVNRYMQRAVDGTFKNRLQLRLVYGVMMIGFAISIRECRLSGTCAAR